MALSGSDVVGIAQTGSGKTLAVSLLSLNEVLTQFLIVFFASFDSY